MWLKISTLTGKYSDYPFSSLSTGQKVNYKTKAVALISLLLLIALGVNIRKEQDYDYAGSGPLTVKEGFTHVDFEFLGGYKFGTIDDIPEPVLALDGKQIQISGYMLPVETKRDKVSSFMLLNNRLACCFSVMPRENEFVFAKMPDGETVKYINDKPVTVKGELDISRDNYVSGIYTIEVSGFSEDSYR